MERVTLRAEPRTEKGSSAARRLRRTGRVPAVMYGKGSDGLPILVDAKELFGALHTDAGLNALIDLHVDGDKELTVAREIQRHPVRGDVLHLDFVKISLTEEIQAEVALEFVGTPVGVKDEGGVLETVNTAVTVQALPAAIPSSIELDIGRLSIGDSLSLADLPRVEDVTYLDDEATTLVTVGAPRIEIEPEAVVVEGEEIEGEEAEVPEAESVEEEAAEGEAAAEEE